MQNTANSFFKKNNDLSKLLIIIAKAIRDVACIKKPNSISAFLDSISMDVRPAVQSISYYVLRNLGWAREIGKLLIKKYPNKTFESLFLVSLSLLKNDKSSKDPIYHDYTIVNESIITTKNYYKLAPYSGLLNAALRNYLRNKKKFNDLANKSIEAQFNYPKWWIYKVKHDYPLNWKEILLSSNCISPLYLRINKKKTNIFTIFELFNKYQIEIEIVNDTCVSVKNPIPIKDLPGFNDGLWSVQDHRAQLAASLLNVSDGMFVLDACSAPGGKTTHLLENADINIISLDIDGNRLLKVKQNLERLGLYSREKVKIIQSDAINISSWWNGVHFDAILADLPCSGSGVVRSHPDIRWIRKFNDILSITKKQKLIIDSLWETLAPGGRMLYVTCSIFPEEGELQIIDFLKKHKDAIKLDSPGQILPIRNEKFPYIGNGFYYSLILKKNIDRK